jgi:predicted nucleic acid-binding protein
MTGADGAGAISEFLAWRIPTVGDDALIEVAYQQSLRFGCSLYDALYVALSVSIACLLVHADRRLRNALGRGFPHAIWLNDYVAQG